MIDQDNQNKGQGLHGDSKGHAQAGQQGGQKSSDTRDSEFYAELGSKQSKEDNPGNFANRDKSDLKDAARRAGQASDGSTSQMSTDNK